MNFHHFTSNTVFRRRAKQQSLLQWTLPIQNMSLPYFQMRWGENLKTKHKTLCHIPRKNVLKFKKKDRICFTQFIVNKVISWTPTTTTILKIQCKNEQQHENKIKKKEMIKMKRKRGTLMRSFILIIFLCYFPLLSIFWLNSFFYLFFLGQLFRHTLDWR